MDVVALAGWLRGARRSYRWRRRSAARYTWGGLARGRWRAKRRERGTGMRVRIRYFASLREAAGLADEALDLPEGASVGQARALLAERRPALAAPLAPCMAAINQRYVAADAPLADGDELVFIPPLGGG